MTENWTEFGVGVFVLIAPWVFGFAGIPLARWTDVLAGLVLVLVNLWAIYGKGAGAPEESASQPVTMKSDIVVSKEERPKRVRRAKVEKVLINS